MIEVVELRDDAAGRAGALLAARHARERVRFPLLPAAFEDPTRAADLVRATLAFSEGLAAFDGDALVGFLTSFESVPLPTSPMARYAPARSSLHLVHGHAVAAGADPGRIYPLLFGELAARALERDITDHVVHVPVGDPSTEVAWVALGFGRANAVAIRDLARLDRVAASDVEIRLATAEDVDVVEQLVDAEAAFHAGSPMFRPYRRDETAAEVRAEIATHVGQADRAFLVARRDRRDVGVLSVGPGLGSPLYVPDGAAYIAATAVVADERGSGVGAALLERALGWAREHGHLAACLHFATANATSTSFWTNAGFVPVMAHMRRRLDERILTGRPRT